MNKPPNEQTHAGASGSTKAWKYQRTKILTNLRTYEQTNEILTTDYYWRKKPQNQHEEQTVTFAMVFLRVTRSLQNWFCCMELAQNQILTCNKAVSSSSISLSMSAINALKVALPIPSLALSFSIAVALDVRASSSSSDLTVATDSCCLVWEITSLITTASSRVCSRVANARLKEVKQKRLSVCLVKRKLQGSYSVLWELTKDVYRVSYEAESNFKEPITTINVLANWFYRKIQPSENHRRYESI